MVVRRTAEDVAAWVTFVARLSAAIARPAASAVDLERAAHRAAKAVFPSEPFTQDNPWNVLLVLTRRFCTLTSVERVDLAGELERALGAAQAHGPVIDTRPGGVNFFDPSPPTPRFRADLDG